MTGQKQSTAAIVSREYKHAPDVCARAIELLLKKPASKKATGTSEGEKSSRGRQASSRHEEDRRQ